MANELKATFFTVHNRSIGGPVMPAIDGASMVGLAQFSPTGAAGVLQAAGGGDFTPPRNGFIRIFCSLPVWVRFSEAGSAAAIGTEHYMPADQPQDFSIRENEKISVIAG